MWRRKTEGVFMCGNWKQVKNAAIIEDTTGKKVQWSAKWIFMILSAIKLVEQILEISRTLSLNKMYWYNW